MHAKIRPRRSSAAGWQLSDPILQEGELGVEFPDTGVGTGICKFKFGDGVTAWADLPYAFTADAAAAIYGGTVTVHNDICLRTGTSEQWETENPVLGLGEIVYDSTLKAIKCGDGETAFNDLEYIGYTWEMDEDYDFGDEDEEPVVPGPDDKDYDFGDIDEED